MKNRDLGNPVEYEVIYKDKIVPVKEKPKYPTHHYRAPQKSYKGGFITMSVIAFLVFILGVGAAGYLIIAKPAFLFPPAAPTMYAVMYRNNTGDDIETLETYAVKKGSTIDDIPQYQGQNPYRPADAGFTYKFNGKWSTKGTLPVSTNIEMFAEYDAIPKSNVGFVVTWNGYDENGNAKVLKQERVKAGEIAEWNDPEPTRPENSEYTYEFDRWNPTDGRAVKQDMVFTAKFKEIKKPKPAITYHVEWKRYNEEGNLETFDDFEVDANTRPGMPSDPKPDRIDPNNHYTYKFKEWEPSVTKPVTGNTTYTPIYEATEVIPEPETKEYLVQWLQYNVDGTTLGVLDEEMVKEGERAKSVNGPAREADEAYTYEFKEWYPDANQKITQDTTFVPQYTKTAIPPETQVYQVTWLKYDDDNNLVTLAEEMVKEGDQAKPVDGPERKADGAYTYEFKEWSPDATQAITADTTFVPQYTKTAIPPKPSKWLVVWKDEGTDGRIWQSEQIENGQTPTYKGPEPYKVSQPGYRYEFEGWDKTPGPISADTTYTAKYKTIADSNEYAWNGKSYSLVASGSDTISTANELYNDTTNGIERVTTFGDGKSRVYGVSDYAATVKVPSFIENISTNSIFVGEKSQSSIVIPKSVKKIAKGSMAFGFPPAGYTAIYNILCGAPAKLSGWSDSPFSSTSSPLSIGWNGGTASSTADKGKITIRILWDSAI